MTRDLHADPEPSRCHEVLDGRDSWLAEYSENYMNNNGRISLSDKLQRKWFTEAMDTLRENKLRLTEYDRELFQKLEDGYSMAGAAMTVTRKQMEHIRQVAFDFERGA